MAATSALGRCCLSILQSCGILFFNKVLSEVFSQADEVRCLEENPKFEYRNPKHIQMTKIPMFKTKSPFYRVPRFWAVSSFEHLNFYIVSNPSIALRTGFVFLNSSFKAAYFGCGYAALGYPS